VIDTVAAKVGVPPDQLSAAPLPDLEGAVRAVEAATPELVEAWTEQQRVSNRLQLAEMDKGQTWTWAWRPATMWGLLAGWIFFLCIVPLVNLFLALLGASAHLVLAVDAATWLTLTGIYMGLYMGGHTIKDVAAKWREGRRV
ncbi:MAG: 3TM-type holin, partial [Nitratireductor sp.]